LDEVAPHGGQEHLSHDGVEPSAERDRLPALMRQGMPEDLVQQIHREQALVAPPGRIASR